MSSLHARVVTSAPMKSWICLFLVTAAFTTQAAPRKAPAAKKASHVLVQKAGKDLKVARSVPGQPARKAGKTLAKHTPAAAALTGTAPSFAAPSQGEFDTSRSLNATEPLVASAAATDKSSLSTEASAAPRSTWQGIRSSVAEKAHRMADTAHQVADKAHGVVDGAAHVVADRTSELVMHAMGFLGVPYRRGGNNAETGFDCSGFVRAMFQQTAGALLPRSAKEQADATQVIDKQELRPGDLVFFNTMRRAFSHVGIYVGDGKFIHSPRSGSVVRVEDMGDSYWTKRFNGARRVGDLDVSYELQGKLGARY